MKPQRFRIISSISGKRRSPPARTILSTCPQSTVAMAPISLQIPYTMASQIRHAYSSPESIRRCTSSAFEVPKWLEKPPPSVHSCSSSAGVFLERCSIISVTAMPPIRVGVKGPSPPAALLPSIIRPYSCAVTEIPPSMWQTIRRSDS